MRNFIPIWIVCFLWIPGFAQESDAPKTLVGFLTPGMNIGILSFENSDKITIDIYTEQDFAIAIDARNLSLEDLASKHEKVASEIERIRKNTIVSLQTSKEKLPAGKEYGEPTIGFRSNPRESFYKIASTGDDYILVTRATAPENRRVFATRFVSSINWRDELPLSVSLTHVDTKTDKTNR